MSFSATTNGFPVETYKTDEKRHLRSEKVEIGRNNKLRRSPLLDDSNSFANFGKLRKRVPNVRKEKGRQKSHCAEEVSVDIRLVRC